MSTERDRATEGVLWPRGRKTVDVRPLAKRLGTLDGITIGELWDDLFRGDEIFPLLREELARRFPGLRKQLERHRSLYETLASAYGIQLAEAQETIETVLADPHDAQLLEVDAGLPLLLLSRHAFDVTGEPVEWAQSWYRGDRYKFVTRLRR